MKYRVFYDDKMWYAEDFVLSDVRLMMALDGTLWKLSNLIYDLVKVEKIDAIAMRWTGLQDKGGKDIYDGDILEFDACDAKESGGFVVKSVVEWEWLGAEWDTGIGTNRECSEFKTVIGNIHEDPSLLA